MYRRPPRSTRTDTPFPYTTLFRSPRPLTGLAIQGVNMRKILLPACVLATALLPMSAMANRADYGFVQIEAGNIDAELEFDGQSASDDDSSYSIRGGYYFSPNWAVEGFYSRYGRSEEPTAELQSLMRISYAVFCLKKKTPLDPAQNSK